MARRLWTQSEIDQLKALYSDTPSIDIAKQLNRSISSVYGMAKALDLYKSEDYMKIELQRQAAKLRIVGASHRFKKGQTPINKGRPMKKEVYDKVKKTMFKPGQKPHNTKYDGHERICSKDGYILVRIKEGVYKHKHRVVWEAQNGPIPEGMAIRFKDGNKLNIDINNLKMVTRADMARLNKSEFETLPQDLKSLIRIKNKVTKTIKNHGTKAR